MATSTHTPNYGLSQYGATDPPKLLTNYNLDMAAIDAAIKAVSDSVAVKTPLSRTIAGLSLTADLTLAQLVAAGLAPADSGHSFGGNGYVKLANGLILEWITFTTPTVAANTTYNASLILSHITNQILAIGNAIPLTAWDFGMWEVAPGDLTHVNLAISNGATAQTFGMHSFSIGT